MLGKLLKCKTAAVKDSELNLAGQKLFYERTPEVVELSDANFNDRVLQSSQVWIVKVQ